MYENRKYVILTRSEVASVDFSKVIETSANTLRYSLDGSKTFVKYDGSQPDFLSGKDELNYSEILTELRTSEWQGSGN
tara:strand:+ start:73 stop:306 length:234 start_codon:yes stop_codon:yes gene_type:complete